MSLMVYAAELHGIKLVLLIGWKDQVDGRRRILGNEMADVAAKEVQVGRQEDRAAIRLEP